MKKIEEMDWRELQEVIRDPDADDDTFDAAWDRRTLIEIDWLHSVRDSFKPGTIEYEVLDDASYRAKTALEEHRHDVEYARKLKASRGGRP